mgnify:CR=1 FL=1
MKNENMYLITYGDYSKSVVVMDEDLYNKTYDGSNVIGVVYIGKASNVYTSGDVIV